MLTVLRQRNFALLWIGGLLSSIGSSMLFFALPLYVYQLTGRALAAAATFFVLTLPRLLLGSVAGVLVDRCDRRRIMVTTNLSAAVIILPLVLVNSADRLWIIYMLALLEYSLVQFFDPTEKAFTPTLVGRDRLTEANSLNSLGDTFTRLAGPVIGGICFGFLGFPSVVVVDVASYIAAALLVAFISVPSTHNRRGIEVAGAATLRFQALWLDWLEGLGLIKRERWITNVFLVTAIAMIAEGIFNAVWVVWARSILRVTPLQFGWLEGAAGVGFFLGGTAVSRTSRVLRHTLLIGVSAAATALGLLVIVNFPNLVVAITVSILAGPPVVMFYITIQTLLQSKVQDAYLGRVFGSYNTIKAVFLLVGVGFAGIATDIIGIITVLNVAAGFWLLAGITALILLDRGGKRRSPLMGPDAREFR